jgi:hypothetical protein
VLYALFMAFLQSHYITAQLYPESEYFFGFWHGVSDAEVLSGLLLASCANIGLLLSPFLRAPRRTVRRLVTCSLSFGAIVSTIELVHLFSIHAFHPFWPARPVDEIYIKMFVEYLLGIYLYLSRIRRLYFHASQAA